MLAPSWPHITVEHIGAPSWRLVRDGRSCARRHDSLRTKFVQCKMIAVFKLLTVRAQTDTLLQQYSQYASMTDLPPEPSAEEADTAKQLQEIFERVREYALRSSPR